MPHLPCYSHPIFTPQYLRHICKEQIWANPIFRPVLKNGTYTSPSSYPEHFVLLIYSTASPSRDQARKGLVGKNLF